MENLINDQQLSNAAAAHIPALVRHAKLQGKLTHDDIERLVPACADDPEMAGQILDLLSQCGVTVTSPYDELDDCECQDADGEGLACQGHDSLADYLKQVRRTRILTREEEFAIFARIEAAKVASQESEALRLRNEVVQRNLRLVVFLARGYLDRGLSLADLVQEGNLGLLKAVDKFELRRGYKLSTYATWWIRQAMSRAVCKHGRSISIPSNVFERFNRIAAAQAELSGDFDRQPTVAELVEHTGIPAEDLSAALKAAFRQASLRSVLGEHADETNPDCIKMLMTGCAGHDDSVQDLLPDVAQVMATLSRQEQEILSLRFGLRDGVERTLEDVAARFNVTRERIRQIEAKALRKLRHPSRLRQLQDFAETSPSRSGSGFGDFAKAA